MKRLIAFLVSLSLFTSTETNADGPDLGAKLGLGLVCAGTIGAIASLANSASTLQPGSAPSISPIFIGSIAVIGVGGTTLVASALSAQGTKPKPRRKIHKDLAPFYESKTTPPYQPYSHTTAPIDLLTSPWYWWFPGNLWNEFFIEASKPIFESESKAHQLPKFDPQQIEQAHTEYLETHKNSLDTFVDVDGDGIPDSVDPHIGPAVSTYDSSPYDSDHSTSHDDSDSSSDSDGGSDGGGDGGGD